MKVSCNSTNSGFRLLESPCAVDHIEFNGSIGARGFQGAKGSWAGDHQQCLKASSDKFVENIVVEYFPFAGAAVFDILRWLVVCNR